MTDTKARFGPVGLRFGDDHEVSTVRKAQQALIIGGLLVAGGLVTCSTDATSQPVSDEGGGSD